MASKLLINEPPLQVLPTLAENVGIVEAIILQQIQYWLITSKEIKRGRKWTYNTYAEWQKQLKFCSDSTIKRAIRKLEKMGLVESATFNKSRSDRTKWYTINYKKVDSLAEKAGVKMTRPTGQNDPSLGSKCAPHAGVKMTPSNLRVKTPTEIIGVFQKALEKYPGTKRLVGTEFDNFAKQHRDWAEILPKLLPAIERQIKHRQYLAGNGSFVPPWKNFQKWINERCWEEHYPAADAAEEPDVCFRCGKPANITLNRQPWCSSDCERRFEQERKRGVV